jgi:excisionase family DNA binding protein
MNEKPKKTGPVQAASDPAVDRYLDKAEAAKYLGVGIRTLEGWMHRLTKYRPGGKAMFRKSELDQFMQQHRQEPTHVDLGKMADEIIGSVLR